MRLLTTEQMRAAEKSAMEDGRATGRELMERAGHGVVNAVFDTWPELAEAGAESPCAVILCGPGNNGGDGFVIARLLADRGWTVSAFFWGNADTLSADARANHDRWQAMGETVSLGFPSCAAKGLERLSAVLQRAPALLVDALLGVGLNRPADALLPVFDAVAASGGNTRRVAVDIPTGLCSDSGRVLGSSDGNAPVLAADLTVTFHAPKLGHVLGRGPDCCGALRVADIGLGDMGQGGSEKFAIEARPLRRVARKRTREHKYAHGHALVVSGGPGKTGAARLAARGALRIGAGLVTLACPMRALPEVATQVTAIMLTGLDGPSGLEEILEDGRISTICMGPGLGLGQITADLVRVALESGRACVLDADALSRFQRDPSVLFGLLHETCVLTPHGGEFARLFPDLAERLDTPADTGPAYSKVDAVRDAAARAGCTILLKGADTVIADATGTCVVNAAVYDRAAPWLATAGAGDVLAGFIAGLLSRGIAPLQAAETAAWLHVEAARRFGPGLIAEDLPETLPAILAELAQGER